MSRLFKKLQWLHTTLVNLQSLVEISFIKEKTRQDVQYLVTNQTKPESADEEIFFLVKNILYAGEFENNLPIGTFPKTDIIHCKKCSYTSKYLSNIVQHIEDKHMTVKKVLQQSNNIPSLVLYKCALCHEEFDRKCDFKSHNLLCKSGLPTAASVECQVCNKLFRSKESLTVHILRDHEGSRLPWSCQLCNKGFTRKASYEEHINRHKGIKERRCDICNKYYYETAYWRHMKTVHASAETFVYSCDVCNKQFTHRFKLKEHSLVHVAKSERKFGCEHPNCNKMFVTQEKLDDHRKSVHENKFTSPLVCGECGATYSKYSSICSHQRNCHSVGKLRPLNCPHCPQTFGAASALNKHINMKHLTIREYVCGYDNCNMILKDSSDLKDHEHQVHSIQTFQIVTEDGDGIEEFSDKIVVIEVDGDETSVTTLDQNVCVTEQDQQTNLNKSSQIQLQLQNGQESKLSIINSTENGHDNLDFQDSDHQLMLNESTQDSMREESMITDVTGELEQFEESVHQSQTTEKCNNTNIHLDNNTTHTLSQVSFHISSHDLKLPVRLFQNVPQEQAKITEISYLDRHKKETSKISKSKIDDFSPAKKTKINLPKTQVYESLLLHNSKRSKNVTKSCSSNILCSSLTEEYSSLPVEFPPLPSSPPDNLLDVAIGDEQDMEEINQTLKQKLLSQTEFDFGIGRSLTSNTTQIIADNRLDLKNVVINISNEAPLYKCSNCSTLIADSEAINSHICDNINPMDHLSQINLHINKNTVKSPKERCFECELCKKKFTTKKVLKRHTRVHTGDRPYTCEFCSKSFAAASNLSEHRTIHTGRMAYSCNICSKKFRLWSIMNKHRLKCQHKEEANIDIVTS